MSDLARSTRFYSAAFAFRSESRPGDLQGPWLDRVVGQDRACLSYERLVNGQGIKLKLLQFEHPPPVGDRTRRPMNAYGLTHLNFYVRDLDATLTDVRSHGGQVHEHTRLDAALGNGSDATMIYCTDPDGVRIEVWTTRPYGSGNSMAAPIPGIDRKFSHSGVCVSDPDRSLSFYAQLGLLPAETFDYRDAPGALDTVIELEGTRLLAQMMRSAEGHVVELLQFAHPRAIGTRGSHPANQYGLSHMAFWVDDLDELAGAVPVMGGRVFPDTRGAAGGVERLQCADPDGVRIMLMQDGGT